MIGSGNNPSSFAPVSNPQATRRRSPLPIAIIAALFIIASFLTWYGNWFGRELSDADIGNYLAEGVNKPRHVQHALIQIGERLSKGDRSVRRWYPQVVSLAASTEAEIRLTVAWLMGRDNESQEFHQTLLTLLGDADPMVRRNAALSLVTFRDSHGRAALRAALQPFSVTASSEGVINSALGAGTPVKRGSLLARVHSNGDQDLELRSPVSGKIESVAVRENERVTLGEPLFSIAPDSASVWEVLRGLYLIGERDDLEDVERYARGVEGMPEQVKQQAALTAQNIQSRSQDVR
jgi:hypothetical protein